MEIFLSCGIEGKAGEIGESIYRFLHRRGHTIYWTLQCGGNIAPHELSKKEIGEAKWVIAIITKENQYNNGMWSGREYVRDEMIWAIASKKETIGFVEEGVEVRGMVRGLITLHGFKLDKAEKIKKILARQSWLKKKTKNKQNSIIKIQEHAEPSSKKEIVSNNTTTPVTNQNAQFKLIAFLDYSCPFSAHFYQNTLIKIIEKYRTKISVNIRDFPLAFHRNSVSAALAVRCAHDQRKFWEMMNLLLQQQEMWVNLENPEGFFQIKAGELDIDVDYFTHSYKNKKHESDIRYDIKKGEEMGVIGTPSIFLILPRTDKNEEKLVKTVAELDREIGGFKIVAKEKELIVSIPGAYPYIIFEKILEAQEN